MKMNDGASSEDESVLADLREKLVTAVRGGRSKAQAARTFGVSATSQTLGSEQCSHLRVVLSRADDLWSITTTVELWSRMRKSFTYPFDLISYDFAATPL
jgi:hypothetical protein